MGHVSLITLGVHDLDRAGRFYTALGWRRSTASVDGTVTFLRGGAIVLSLFGWDDLARDATIDAAPASAFSGIALAMNLSSEAAVDATLDTVVEAGGQVAKPAERADWGGYSGYFTDPDGHLWEVAHNPGFPVMDDGRVRLPDD